MLLIGRWFKRGRAGERAGEGVEGGESGRLTIREQGRGQGNECTREGEAIVSGVHSKQDLEKSV